MKAFRILLMSVMTFTGLAVAPQMADAGAWDRRARQTYRHWHRPHSHHHHHHNYRPYRHSYRHWGHHHHHHHRRGGIGIHW